MIVLVLSGHLHMTIRVFRKVGVEVVPFAVPDVLHSTEHWEGKSLAFETIETVKIRGWVQGSTRARFCQQTCWFSINAVRIPLWGFSALTLCDALNVTKGLKRRGRGFPARV